MSENFSNFTNSSGLKLNGYQDFQEYEGRSIVTISIISIFLIIIMLTAILGNIGVIFAIANCASLRKDVSYILIINLAITDLSNGSFVMLSALVSLVMDSWKLGQVICDITCALNYCLMITSMLTLFFISIDRYQAIIHPLQYHTRVTKRHIIVFTIYSWFQGTTFSIIPVVFGWIEYDYWEVVCAINWFKEQKQALYYVIAAFILCYLIPGVLMAFCYIKISCVANETTVASSSMNCQAAQQRKNASTKVIRSLIIVVVAYFVCLTPFSVTKLMKVISKHSVARNANTAASIIAYCSSAVNPWIYGIFRKDFRHAYKILFKRLCTKFDCIALHTKNSHTSTSTEISELSDSTKI